MKILSARKYDRDNRALLPDIKTESSAALAAVTISSDGMIGCYNFQIAGLPGMGTMGQFEGERPRSIVRADTMLQQSEAENTTDFLRNLITSILSQHHDYLKRELPGIEAGIWRSKPRSRMRHRVRSGGAGFRTTQQSGPSFGRRCFRKLEKLLMRGNRFWHWLAGTE